MRVLRIGKSVAGLTRGLTYESFCIGHNTFRIIDDDGLERVQWWDFNVWELIEEEEEMRRPYELVDQCRGVLRTDTLTYMGKEKVKSMKLEDLKAGMRFETRNGEQGLVFKRSGGGICLLIEGNISRPINLIASYYKDLKHGSKNRLDIVKVWQTHFNSNHVCDLSRPISNDPLWERKEVKELTVAEIEKLLGYGVKVVK